MANIARMIAAAGAMMGGYAKNEEMNRERSWQDEERAQKRQELADKKVLREALAGGGADRNAATLTAGATDLADVTGGMQPRSAQIDPMQNVGGNYTSDPGFAQSMAENESFATGQDVQPTTSYRVGGAGVYSDPAEAIDASRQAANTVQQQGIDVPLNRAASAAYYQRKAPAVIDAYLRTGNVDGAKKYRDFIASEEGRNYTEQWSRGVRKLAIGDHDSALKDWQDLYNRQLYDDGKTVKLTPTQDGKQVQVDFFDKSGNPLQSVTQPIDTLARQAGLALSPEKLVEMRAQQEAKRVTEGALLDRQVQLEQLRQQGQEVRDDRRDERMGMRIDAQSEQLDRRLSASGGLTVPQQRANNSIEAARIKLRGMSQPDVVKKSQPSGREFDPEVARIYRLANTRKYGEDSSHDAYSTGAQQSNAITPIQRASAALAADPAMAGFKLGEQTMKGFKVLDANGKHVGYFGKQ